MGEDDPTSETGKDEETVSLPSFGSLPAPPEITFTRPSLGKGTPSTHRAETRPRAEDGGQSSRHNDDDRLLAQGVQGYGVAITAALTLAITVGIFIFIGQWLDKRYHTTVPWFTIVGLLLGVFGGFANMIRLLTTTRNGRGKRPGG
ncbi:MAG: AtpZ/AtpI family protein [Capsulimonas sp.]|uniref:AtpZ/AtpI family protein n=1 Tax=Capsulimonas sp. TaxID=2494211 RepID=UPI003263165E